MVDVSFFFCLVGMPPPNSTPFPYTSLFRSSLSSPGMSRAAAIPGGCCTAQPPGIAAAHPGAWLAWLTPRRSEEHTSELQSLRHLVCRLLLVKIITIHSDARDPVSIQIYLPG